MSAVGFTGTRNGLNPYQKTALYAELTALRKEGAEFHHGDCVGADADAADMASDLGYWVVVHPPTDDRLRAGMPADDERPALPYLERNRAIVDASSVLVACPDGSERVRSGTWSTVRYARAQGVQVVVIRVDGSTA